MSTATAKTPDSRRQAYARQRGWSGLPAPAPTLTAAQARRLRKIEQEVKPRRERAKVEKRKGLKRFGKLAAVREPLSKRARRRLNPSRLRAHQKAVRA